LNISFKYNFSIRIDGSIVTTLENDYDIEAYDKIGIVIAPGETKNVTIQPNSQEINFLVIESTKYATESGKLIYSIVGDPQTTEITLFRPHFLVGEFIVQLFRIIPTELSFTNNLTEAVTIKILVGRKATIV
jgi:hypothetical protein